MHWRIIFKKMMFVCSLVFTELGGKAQWEIHNMTCVFELTCGNENLQEVYLYSSCVFGIGSCLGYIRVILKAYWHTPTCKYFLSRTPLPHVHFGIRLNSCIICYFSCIWWGFYQKHKRKVTLHANECVCHTLLWYTLLRY